MLVCSLAALRVSLWSLDSTMVFFILSRGGELFHSLDQLLVEFQRYTVCCEGGCSLFCCVINSGCRCIENQDLFSFVIIVVIFVDSNGLACLAGWGYIRKGMKDGLLIWMFLSHQGSFNEGCSHQNKSIADSFGCSTARVTILLSVHGRDDSFGNGSSVTTTLMLLEGITDVLGPKAVLGQYFLQFINEGVIKHY
jgi:hypothetical protein